MREIIAFLKRAVDRTGGPRSCYMFAGGTVSAQNNNFSAGALLAVGVDINILAEELEKFLDRTTTNPVVKLNKEGVVTITEGRLRATMRHYADVEPTAVNTTGVWLDVPPDLAAALVLAVKYTGDRIWMQDIRLQQNRVTAINGRVGVDITVDGLEIDPNICITKETAEYLGAYPPDHYRQAGSNHLLFRWDDGRWLKAQLSVDKFPAQVDTIFDAAGKAAATCKIDEDWRAAYADAAAMTDSLIVMLHDRFLVERNSSMIEIACATDVPQGHQSRWTKEVMDLVIHADAWAPTTYPDPVAFVGHGYRGVCMGIKR